MRILITGGTGFVGSWLLEAYLNETHHEIFSTRSFRSNMENVVHIEDRIKWLEADITDAHSVETIIKDIKPDIIHHLAGQSYVPASWKYPTNTFEVNVLGSINLFEAVRKFRPECVIQIASSSEIYGIPDEVPITEKMLPKPCSPYGVSKLAMDRLGVQYHHSYGLKIVVTRAFNHTGPRRNEVFVASSFAKQIVEIEKGLKDPVIKVGNLDAIRDFTDVRDMCQAYMISVSLCEYGEPYNICSGKGIKIKELLDFYIKNSKIKIEIEKDSDRLRPSDLHTLIGDSSKFRASTKWEPKIDFIQTQLDLLDYWKKK